MRLKRFAFRAGIAGAVLLAVLLLASLLLALLLPADRYERLFREFLNRNLPVKVEFDRPGIAWNRGLGITLPSFRILEKQAPDRAGEILTARRLVLRPSLSALWSKEFRISLLLEAPRVDLSAVPRAAAAGAEGARTPPAASLSGMLSLPGGLTLARVDLRIVDGQLFERDQGPAPLPAGRTLSDIQANLVLEDDFSFNGRVRNCLTQWPAAGGARWAASGRISGRVSGRYLPTATGQEPPAAPPAPDEAPGENPEPRHPGQALGGTAQGRDPPREHLRPVPWLSLEGLEAAVEGGSVRILPAEGAPAGTGLEIQGIHAGLKTQSRAALAFDLREGSLRWQGDGETPWRLSARLKGSVSAKVPAGSRPSADGSFRLEGLDVQGPAGALALPETLEILFSQAEISPGRATAAGILVRGAGLEARSGGALAWSDNASRLSLTGPAAEISDFRSLLYLLPPDTRITGHASLSANAVSFRLDSGPPSGGAGPSFLIGLPEGLGLESFRARFDQVRVLIPHGGRFRLALEDLQAQVDQEGERQWKGRLDAGSTEIALTGPPEDNAPKNGLSASGPGDPVRAEESGPSLSGPLSLQWSWAEQGPSAHAVAVADLTGARAVYQKLLDKPAGVPLQAGARVRFEKDRIEVGRAFLRLGETDWTLSARLAEPADPLLETSLSSGAVSLDRLPEISPAARDHHLQGLLEIQELRLTGRTRSLRETATLQVRLSARELEYNRASLQSVVLRAVYGKQILTVNPLAIRPGEGRVEAALTGDFSGAFRDRGRQQYYGTAKLENVSLDKLVTLVRPQGAGRVSGVLDAKLACRGTGVTWEELRRTLEARARMYVRDFRIHGEGGNRFLDRIAPGEPQAVDPETLDQEARRLLSGNHGSALLSLANETLEVKNLAATYDGKVLEMTGSLDFDGRLRVNPGRLFLQNRMIPFQVDCRLGQGRCVPSPDLRVMGRSAVREMYNSLWTISTGSRDVFKELLF